MKPRPKGREPYFHHMFVDWSEVEDTDRFPFTIPAVREMGKLEFHPAVTFFVGENGSGKSTLVEAVATRLDFDEKGGANYSNFGARPLDGGLHDYLRISKNPRRRPADWFFMRAETVFDFANDLDRSYEEDRRAYLRYGSRSLHSRSHGEAFLAIIQNRLQEEGMFIMDEPEAALSPSRQLTLLKEIDWLVRGGSQFIIATHSPILLAYPDAVIYELSGSGVRPVSYKETEHYTLTRSFLENPEAFLRHLVE